MDQRLHNSINDQFLQFACSTSPLPSTSPASEENRSTGEASPIGFFLSQLGRWHCKCQWPLALLFMLGAFVGLTWKPTDPNGNLARSECATGEGIAEDMVVFHICVFPPSNLREEQWGLSRRKMLPILVIRELSQYMHSESKPPCHDSGHPGEHPLLLLVVATA